MTEREDSRPVSERLFESHLSSLGLQWEYEPILGGKRPDYLIASGSSRFVVEVEELRNPNPLPVDAYDPTLAVREALRRARNQLRGCKDLPSGIVVYSDSPFRSVTSETVAGAAFDPGFQDARRHDRVSLYGPALRFPPPHECPLDGSKLANPFLSRTHNKSIGAVLILMRYALDEFRLAVWRELLQQQQQGERLAPAASLAVAAQLQHRVPLTYRFAHTIRVVVLENRHANIRFPDVFCGPFDQRWTWQDDWLVPTWIGNDAAACFAEGVPFDLL